MLPIHLSKPPRTLGRYEVGAKIGGGGMATVYLGRDIREDGTEDLVALKVIRDELVHDEQFAAMFIDEAKILARLSHPNVIQTLEYGISGDHRFIAMELLNGRTLSDTYDVLTADEAKFDLGVAAWICARVAEGVHSAHELVDERGQPLSVIHRDVNPTNIFLTHSGEVKLIDFGLARARVRVSKSVDGIVKGKIPYLAPEQAFGRPIDRRIDLYALGTTLWEMSTMKRLFKRDTDIATLTAIRDAKVPNLREENPEFPEALWKIIERALKIDPEERYQTAAEMRTDLDAFARGSAPHGPKVAKLVSHLFPGGEARQAKWLRDAASVRIPDEATLPPPAPVPIASSSLLDEDNHPPSLRSIAPPPPPPAPPTPVKISYRPEPEPAVPPVDDGDVAMPVVAAPVSTRPRSRAPSKATAPKKVSRRPPTDPNSKKKSAKRASSERSKAPLAAAENKGRLWLIVAAAVAALLIFAIAATR